MNILFDIDDTLCRTSKHWRKAANKYFEKNGFKRIKPKYQDSFKIEDSYEMLSAQKAKFLATMHQESFFLTMKPIRGAVKAIRALAQECNIDFITKRPTQIQEATDVWIRENFKIFRQVNFVSDFAEWLPEQEIDVLIDNSVERCLIAISQGVKAYLFCGAEVDDNTKRADELEKVYNYKQVIEKIKGDFYGR